MESAGIQARTLIVAALLAALPLAAQIRRLRPVDESGRDTSLVAFLAKFREAAAQRDRAALLPMIDPDVKLGFGGDDGIANFQPDWDGLNRILAMGGAWAGAAFVLPYVAERFPDSLDVFDYAAITGRGVWLRAGPSPQAERLRQMSYETVRVESQDTEWWKVVTQLGESGYVSARFVYSPIGLRAIFEKRGGQWMLRALVAGD